jgi:hypothetical protein
MVDGVVKDTIARRAGISPDQLDGVATSAVTQTPAPSEPSQPSRHRITTRVLTSDAGDDLPIVDVDAQAPDANGAATLANAAVAGLRQYLNSQAAVDRVPDARRLRVTGLGPAQAGVVDRGPSGVMAIAVAIVLFGVGCGMLLIVRWLAREWLAVAEEEEEEALIAARTDADQAPLTVVSDPSLRNADDWFEAAQGSQVAPAYDDDSIARRQARAGR